MDPLSADVTSHIQASETLLPVPGPYLQLEYGFSVSLVGLCFGICAILYAVASPLAGCACALMKTPSVLLQHGSSLSRQRRAYSPGSRDDMCL